MAVAKGVAMGPSMLPCLVPVVIKPQPVIRTLPKIDLKMCICI